jgi:hypothetical protein
VCQPGQQPILTRLKLCAVTAARIHGDVLMAFGHCVIVAIGMARRQDTQQQHGEANGSDYDDARHVAKTSDEFPISLPGGAQGSKNKTPERGALRCCNFRLGLAP